MTTTGQRGTPKSSMCWLRWDSAWVSGTCGDSRTFATKMEAVSIEPEMAACKQAINREDRVSEKEVKRYKCIGREKMAWMCLMC